MAYSVRALASPFSSISRGSPNIDATTLLSTSCRSNDAVGVGSVGLDQREGDIAVPLRVVRELDAP